MQVACMMGREMRIGVWLDNRSERDHLENVGIGGRIILKWILKINNLG